MTKERSSEILVDENRNIFLEKVKFGKFSTESENFSETRGTPKQGGENASLPQGDGRLWPYINVKDLKDHKTVLHCSNSDSASPKPGNRKRAKQIIFPVSQRP